ncbi:MULTISPECIES: hypothetical protein [unclassified Xanthomonas]|uniref:hypothetical protein n=1 Tax=unclassified Xanthomonas TaxID=2643310 RepID=UPI002A80CE1C|nr:MULTISPECIES: hypothetical protein [unclassified Xanthomonas]MDY4297547.1 hypothetical protein [Xanthomonas sp. LF02-5]MDY4359341.1 hypothetical protein [Xanthomonas sp. LF04-12]
MSAIDPIDKLAASGISVRTLVSFQLDHIEWLAQHQGDTFRLCYHDEAGVLVVETIKGDPAALLQRAQDLGWQPEPDQPYEGGEPWIFQAPFYHLRRGVHWYSTAVDEDADNLPMGFPPKELASARRRMDAYYSDAAVEKRRQKEEARIRREKAAQERQRTAKYRDNHRAAVALHAETYMDAAKIIGKPISKANAVSRARKFLRECNDGDYNMWLTRAARTLAANGSAK